jgi:hypothetical protein
MKTNKDLTVNEFIAAQNIKRAMIHLDNPDQVRVYLTKALGSIYSEESR